VDYFRAAQAVGEKPFHPKVVSFEGLSKAKETSMPIKPSIVFCHGIWADGSCFSKVIPTLHAEGYQVIAAQYGLDTLEATSQQ
jgi:hypothetical protein